MHVMHSDPSHEGFAAGIKADLINTPCPLALTKQDSNLGQSRMTVFEDCQATALTIRPPRPYGVQFFLMTSFMNDPLEKTINLLVTLQTAMTFQSNSSC